MSRKISFEFFGKKKCISDYEFKIVPIIFSIIKKNHK